MVDNSKFLAAQRWDQKNLYCQHFLLAFRVTFLQCMPLETLSLSFSFLRWYTMPSSNHPFEITELSWVCEECVNKLLLVFLVNLSFVHVIFRATARELGIGKGRKKCFLLHNSHV
jgi:hypothetical protein